MRIQKRLSASTALAGVLLCVPAICAAAAGAQELATFVERHIITQGLIAFWGISWGAMFYYAMRMILTSQNDDAFTQASSSFINAFTGFAIIACSAAFATAFTTSDFSGSAATGVNASILENSIVSVSNFMITMSAGIFVLMIVLSGIRMITTMGEEGAFDKAKKLLGINCGGVVLMLIASAIVNGVASTDSGIINEELIGIGKFLLTLLGFLCVIALVIAGIYLIVSIDEGNRDKAKKIVIGTLITLVIIFILYTLILTFV